jgi:flavin-dependent dehydrogenase
MFAAQGRRVLLLDAARFPRRKPCAEYVSPGGAAILGRLGALDGIGAPHTGRWLRGMAIHGPGGGCHEVSYQLPDGFTKFGLSVPRLTLDAGLLDLAAAAGAEVRQACRVRHVVHAPGSSSRVRGVELATGEQVMAELVVGADGLHSVVARAVGAARAAHWPRRLGLVAHFEGVDWPEESGWMVVGAAGYVGIAPLDRDGLVTVGLVRELPRGRLGSAEAALFQGLRSFPRVEARLRRGRLVGNVMGVGPLARTARAVAGDGWALVGDAAGFFDPFTGEGIFRALRGAELLTASPTSYARDRRQAFAAKQRLVAFIQVLVQTPRLMDLAIARLGERPAVARELGAMLGDLQPARLGIAWRLLGP